MIQSDDIMYFRDSFYHHIQATRLPIYITYSQMYDGCASLSGHNSD